MPNQFKAISRRAQSRFLSKHQPSLAAIEKTKFSPFAALISSDNKGAQKTLHFELLHKDSTRGPSRIDISIWLNWPGLMEPFLFAAKAYAQSVNVHTFANFLRALNCGWFTFLSQQRFDRNIILSDISNAMIGEYVDTVGRKNASGEYSLMKATRNFRVNPLRRVIRILRSSLKYQNSFRKNLHIPKNLWLGGSRDFEPTEAISGDVVGEIYNACVRDIQRQLDKRAEGTELIATHTPLKASEPVTQASYKELGNCLAAIASIPNGILLDHIKFKEEHPRIYFAMNSYHGGFKNVIGYFAPSARDLVPFVLLLGLQTAFNPDVLLSLSSDDFEYREIMGKTRIFLRPYKKRSRRRQNRSFSTEPSTLDNPGRLLRILDEFTSPLRQFCHPVFKNRLFLFILLTRKFANEIKKPRAFGLRSGAVSGDQAYKGGQETFRNEYNIPKFTLNQLRITSLDIVGSIFQNNLLALKAAGGQRNPQVLLDHYRSGMMRSRDSEALGEVMSLHERWVSTKGLIDPRTRPHAKDVGAATPGFHCHDPFQSPLIGQTQGKLCTAYGQCPNCPLAAIDFSSAFALACLRQLQVVLQEARKSLPAQRWLEAWGPVEARVESYWLPAFDKPHVLAEAHGLSIPSFSPIE